MVNNTGDSSKSQNRTEELLQPRRKSGLLGFVKKHSNKSLARSTEEPKRKVKAKEPVHSHSVVYETPETPTPPLSPVSSDEASPVANINVVHRNASKDHEHEEGDDMDTSSDEERTMFSDITDNRSHFPGNHTSPKTSPISSPNRDKSKKDKNSSNNNNNSNAGVPQNTKVRASIDADAVGGVTGVTTGGTVMSAKPNPPTAAPGNLNTAEAMKDRMRNRQTESACCGNEEAVDDSTFVSKMFACNVPANGACHVPGGAYTLDGNAREGDNSIPTKENGKNSKQKKSFAQQQQQQQEDLPQHSALRKVLSFTPVWGVAPSMDDGDCAMSPSESPELGERAYSYSSTNTNPYNKYSQSNSHSMSQSQSNDSRRSTDSPMSTTSMPDGIEIALEDFHVEDKDTGKESVRRGWKKLFQKHKGDGGGNTSSSSSSSGEKKSPTSPARSPTRITASSPRGSPSRFSKSKSSKSKSKTKTPPPPPPSSAPPSSATKKDRSSSNASPKTIRYERMPEEDEEKEVDEIEEDHESTKRRLTASLQEELVAARATAYHKKRERKKAAKEARYKYLLSSFKGSPKRTTLLETVMEGDGEHEGPKTNENTEMKVRVPGMDQLDSFLTDEDLVGAEFIEEGGDQEEGDGYFSSEESDDDDELQPAPGATVPDEPVTSSVAVAVADEATVEEAVPEPAVVEEKQKLWLSQIIKVDTQKLWLESIAKIVKVPCEKVDPPPDETVADPSSPKRVHLENPNPFKKSNSMPKRDNDSSNSIQRTRSWYERLGLKKVGSFADDDIKSSDSVSLVRNRSAPLDFMKNSMKANSSKKKPKGKNKPLWKATVDESSGLTYYYHRLTRQTTWTRPDNFGQPAPSYDEEDDIEKVQHSGETEEQIAKKKEIMELLRKQSSRDFDPEVWKTKNKIVDILTTMAPPDGHSIERLMKSYEGNEEILLTNLRDLSDSRPFDEPIKSASTGSPDDVSRFEDMSPERSSFGGMRSRSGATSLLSSFSGITKVSEKTELIRNTAGNTTKPTLDSSFGTDVSNNDVHGLGETISPARVPSKIPVPRLRELKVEEFTTDERVKAETFAGSGFLRSPRKSYHREEEEEPSFFSVFDPYVGDNDDTTDVDTVTDAESVPTAISGLSEARSTSDDFANRTNDVGRRRALDEAIAKEDWDLAADLSERLRANTKSKSAPRRVPKEWTQSELDKFISENDWDAVANYIAHVRDSAKTSSQRNHTAAPTSSQRKLIGPANPKKRFGALSQLQHGDINSDSSYDSDDASSYYSDDYSSASSYTDEDDPLYMAANSKRRGAGAKKEFTC
jgi:hypothetical protein